MGEQLTTWQLGSVPQAAILLGRWHGRLLQRNGLRQADERLNAEQVGQHHRLLCQELVEGLHILCSRPDAPSAVVHLPAPLFDGRLAGTAGLRSSAGSPLHAPHRGAVMSTKKLTHRLTFSLTSSLTHSFTHSLTDSLTDSLTHLLTHL